MFPHSFGGAFSSRVSPYHAETGIRYSDLSVDLSLKSCVSLGSGRSVFLWSSHGGPSERDAAIGVASVSGVASNTEEIECVCGPWALQMCAFAVVRVIVGLRCPVAVPVGVANLDANRTAAPRPSLRSCHLSPSATHSMSMRASAPPPRHQR